MTGAVIANFPIIALIVLGIVGVPLWMTFKRPQTGADHSEARAYLRSRDSFASALARRQAARTRMAAATRSKAA